MIISGMYPPPGIPPRQRTDEDVARDIVRAGAAASTWTDVPEHFTSGGVMGFDTGMDSVRAMVRFDSCKITVEMTSPAACSCSRLAAPRRTALASMQKNPARLTADGSDTGEATERCIVLARKLITELYCDYFMLKMQEKEIRLKSLQFGSFSERFTAQEQERVAAVKAEIKSLSQESGRIKQAFKNGGMTQMEYVSLRKPVHNRIVEMMQISSERDPFSIFFSDEIKSCRYASPARELVEQFM